MPRTLFCWLLAAHVLAGCASLAPAERDRPRLLLEGREWNAPLLNPRPPHYGISEPAGDVVLREFVLSIDRLAHDAAGGRLLVAGRLLEPRGGETFGFLLTRDSEGRPVRTPALPGFSLTLDLAQNSTLAIEGIGHRTLLVDLRALSRRAEPAAVASTRPR